jgi:hypothetical protein
VIGLSGLDPDTRQEHSPNCPFMSWLLQRIGPEAFDSAIATFARLPRWYLIFTVIVVGGGEEWLYRAYAIESQ